MAYSLETSSVKTIVPGAEVSGFADVVARQKINEVSATVPQLSAGEGIDISTVDGKTVITNNISAGENISLVYDMETNTYRIDSNGGGGGNVVSPYGTLLTNGNSAEASISGVIPEHNVNYDTVSSNVAFWVGNYQDPHNTITLNSANTVYFKANENQYSTGIVDLTVYENDTVTTSFQGTAFNYTTSYSEPTNVRLVMSVTGAGAGITASTISSNYAVTIPHEIVNLYEVPQHTQTEINNKAFVASADSNNNTGFFSNPVIIYSAYANNGRGGGVAVSSTAGLTRIGWLAPNSTAGTTYGNSNKFLGWSTTYKQPGWQTLDVYQKTETSSNAQISAADEELRNAINYVSSNAGLYTGIDPIQVNNTDHEISITGESISAGPGIDMFSSGGYVVISADGSNLFPITGTNGTTGFTANMDCSSMYISTGAGPAGAIVHFDTKGVHFEAYPATDVSASWFNLITQYNNATCSAVKLTTAASENWFYTSALPNLNEITFIAPSYGPYETYSALIDDGDTTFVAEVDSGCCMKVVRNWNDDRNKNCWCGLPQESYFYIG